MNTHWAFEDRPHFNSIQLALAHKCVKMDRGLSTMLKLVEYICSQFDPVYAEASTGDEWGDKNRIRATMRSGGHGLRAWLSAHLES